MNRNKIAIVLGIVCFLLAMAITVQINTMKGTTSRVSKNREEDSLRDEVLKWKENYETEMAKLDRAEKELSTVREQTSKSDTASSAKEAEIKLNNNLLGLTEVQGMGIELTVKDDPNASNSTIGVYDDISAHIVHDGDLRRIVNELKNAGAEAIEINGQRIVNTTAITCIGNVIKINDEKVSSPFIIKVIGFQEIMESALNRPGGYLELLQDDGISTSIKKFDNLKINKYNGIISSKYMR